MLDLDADHAAAFPPEAFADVLAAHRRYTARFTSAGLTGIAAQGLGGRHPVRPVPHGLEVGGAICHVETGLREPVDCEKRTNTCLSTCVAVALLCNRQERR